MIRIKNAGGTCAGFHPIIEKNFVQAQIYTTSERPEKCAKALVHRGATALFLIIVQIGRKTAGAGSLRATARTAVLPSTFEINCAPANDMTPILARTVFRDP